MPNVYNLLSGSPGKKKNDLCVCVVGKRMDKTSWFNIYQREFWVKGIQEPSITFILTTFRLVWIISLKFTYMFTLKYIGVYTQYSSVLSRNALIIVW